MYAYKGFEPDLSCRGYRFVMGKNVTPEANCASNGFHCAENPLDCLTYYSDMDRSIYCLVQPGGDIDEDDRDSKIACTELTILRQLTRKEFFSMRLPTWWITQAARRVTRYSVSTALAATAMPSFEARNPLRVENWAIFSHLPESGVKPK